MKKIFVISSFLLALAACEKDFEEINTNPNDPSVVATADLMAGAQRSLVRSLFGMYDDWGIAYIPHVYMQYWAATLYTNVDRYETITLDFTDFYVEALNDFNEVIELNSDEKMMLEAAKYGPNENQIAVARIMKAYTFHNLTDIWGAIPYSEALQGNSDFTPKYDDQQFIYEALITELTEAAAQIDEDAGSIEGDIIYGGNMAAWKLFANSLRLRLGMRLSKVAPDKAQAIVAEAVHAGVFTSQRDNAVYQYLASAPNNSGWNQQYTFGAPEYACSEILVNRLVELDDPRLEAYAQPSEATGEYVGMIYGVSNAEAGGIGYSNVSLPGVRVLSTEEPAILMGYSEVLFLQAEAAAKGWINDEPKTLYEHAIAASFEYWDVSLDGDALNSYLQQDGVAYDADNYEKSIGEQAWLAFYTQGPEAWSS
ncbi:MAG TPA: SusD/RagB family nutrient-binding outer membrane lipoprotein, partial [Chryseolinea sp.]|nr:SusD/RagB family nutrient-binding outer membrane lipoprotein [Chryseolinea sp.]